MNFSAIKTVFAAALISAPLAMTANVGHFAKAASSNTMQAKGPQTMLRNYNAQGPVLTFTNRTNHVVDLSWIDISNGQRIDVKVPPYNGDETHNYQITGPNVNIVGMFDDRDSSPMLAVEPTIYQPAVYTPPGSGQQSYDSIVYITDNMKPALQN